MPPSETDVQRAKKARAYLDSNVFLQFKPLTQIDWRGFLAADEVDLVIAPVVLRELELKKHGDNKRLRKRAAMAIRMITEICVGEELDGRVGDGVTLRVLPSEPRLDFETAGLNRSTNDDWLIAALVEDVASDPIAVTDDAPLRMKLRGRKIRHIAPLEEARLAPEEDEETKQLREENRALKQRLEKRPRLSLGNLDGGVVINANVRVFDPLEDPTDIVAARRRELLAQVDLRNRQGVPGGVSISAAGAFSEDELDSYLAALLEYHRALHKHADKVSRTTGVDLQLRNDGSAPASGIEIRIVFPDDVEVGEDMYPAEDPPEPNLPKFFQAAWINALFGPYSSGAAIQRRLRNLTSFGSHVVEVDGLRENRWSAAAHALTTRVTRLLHKRDIQLTQFPVVFPVRDRRISGFSARAVVLVTDPADELEVDLSFVPSSR